jgi:AcrR family transcriptional regulator
MSGIAIGDRRTERNAQTRRQILDAAWDLVRENGLASLAMRDLGERVGMRAQSIYVYFPSKHAIFDAMYAEGHQQASDMHAAVPEADDPRETLRRHARGYVQFATDDPVRYQLLYQRTIPGFEPSAESYEIAKHGLDYVRRCLRACGITGRSAVDAFTALTGGIAAQQNANEPGGKRWVRLTDELTDMYLAHYLSTRAHGSGSKP